MIFFKRVYKNKLVDILILTYCLKTLCGIQIKFVIILHEVCSQIY